MTKIILFQLNTLIVVTKFQLFRFLLSLTVDFLDKR